jgi:hypothetical protein
VGWDVLLLGDLPGGRLAELPRGWRPPPLGGADEVRRALSAGFERHGIAVDWSDPSWGQSVGDGFTLELQLGDDPVECVTLHLRGGGDPVAPILSVCAELGWIAVDGSTGEPLAEGKPSSWLAYQRFAERAFGRR